MQRPTRFLSRIGIRLLAFNLLLVFLPLLGILSLESYEENLLDMQERAMVQQGRILAAALSERGPLDGAEAERILINLQQRQEARLRVVDVSSRLLADSSRLGPRSDEQTGPPQEVSEAPRQSPLYRLGLFLYRLYDRLFLEPEPPPSDEDIRATEDVLTGPEIERALEGRYGTATRVSPASRSLTLFSALPVLNDGEVVGAVLVSKSTSQILRTLYQFRLDIFEVILASVVAATVLSLLLATTIARPLARLQQQARLLVDRRGRLRSGFRPLRRLDEIGDLSRALAELTDRLEEHIRFIESFASDVSHEFKNPLASIRNATELLAEVDDPADRQRFQAMILRDIARLERLLSDVREITHLDAELDEQSMAPVELTPLLSGLIERFEMRAENRLTYQLSPPPEPLVVSASPQRLAQVFENMLDNASSFSPEGGIVEVELSSQGDRAVVHIADQGPGIPEAHLQRVFQRFFCYRPHGPARNGHTGLGLAIVKAIVEGYGGTVRAANQPEGGAVMEVCLPRETAS